MLPWSEQDSDARPAIIARARLNIFMASNFFLTVVYGLVNVVAKSAQPRLSSIVPKTVWEPPGGIQPESQTVAPIGPLQLLPERVVRRSTATSISAIEHSALLQRVEMPVHSLMEEMTDRPGYRPNRPPGRSPARRRYEKPRLKSGRSRRYRALQAG